MSMLNKNPVLMSRVDSFHIEAQRPGEHASEEESSSTYLLVRTEVVWLLKSNKWMDSDDE